MIGTCACGCVVECRKAEAEKRTPYQSLPLPAGGVLGREYAERENAKNAARYEQEMKARPVWYEVRCPECGEQIEVRDGISTWVRE